MNEEARRFIVEYVKMPKNARSTHIRENETMRMLTRQLAIKYGLKTPHQVYELAVISIGLGVDPEEVAAILKKIGKRGARKTLFQVYEQLLLNEGLFVPGT